MPNNRMQPETLEEARDRLLDMSAAERRGFESATEGQLIPMAESIADPDGPEQELHELQDQMRLRRSIQDRPDEDAVDQTRKSVAEPLAERREIRRDPEGAESRRKASQPKSGSKSQGKGSEAKARREQEREERKAQRDAEKAKREAERAAREKESDGSQTQS